MCLFVLIFFFFPKDSLRKRRGALSKEKEDQERKKLLMSAKNWAHLFVERGEKLPNLDAVAGPLSTSLSTSLSASDPYVYVTIDGKQVLIICCLLFVGFVLYLIASKTGWKVGYYQGLLKPCLELWFLPSSWPFSLYFPHPPP